MPVEYNNISEDAQSNELIEKKVNAIATAKFLKDLEKLEELKAKFAVKEAEVKEGLMKLFESNDIKSFSNDRLEIIYVPEYVREGVDTAKLKEDNLYEQYKKETNVKASIRIKVKYD